MAPVPPTPIFPIRLPEHLKAELKAIADAERRSLSNLIVIILEEWLAARKRQP